MTTVSGDEARKKVEDYFCFIRQHFLDPMEQETEQGTKGKIGDSCFAALGPATRGG